jgi:hypothetical protein
MDLLGSCFPHGSDHEFSLSINTVDEHTETVPCEAGIIVLGHPQSWQPTVNEQAGQIPKNPE